MSKYFVVYNTFVNELVVVVVIAGNNLKYPAATLAEIAPVAVFILQYVSFH